MTTVWIYVDTKYHVGHPDHLKVFANPVAADEWFKDNDPRQTLGAVLDQVPGLRRADHMRQVPAIPVLTFDNQTLPTSSG